MTQYNAAGYYSPTYLLMYYDGYGYNFYTGAYGYYEYSLPSNERVATSELGDYKKEGGDMYGYRDNSYYYNSANNLSVGAASLLTGAAVALSTIY